MNDYTMEELLPIMSGLVSKYTSNDSTSVSYEKARQLMGSILYCIAGAWQMPEGREVPLTASGLAAEDAYRIGLERRKEKVEAAKIRYQGIREHFVDINNEFYRATLLDGLPAFFENYDLRFHAQDTILTLDYPLHREISGLTGIDMIYEYLKLFEKEQEFLRQFSQATVEEALYRYHKEYSGLVINIYEIVQKDLEYCNYLEQRDGN